MGFVTNRWQPISAGPAPVVPVRYGVKITRGATPTITYLYDAAGFTPASMNFSTGVFNWGSWANTPLVNSIYPIVTSNRSTTTAIGYKLDPSDLTKKSDGTPIDDPLTGNVATVFEGGWLHTEYTSSGTNNTYTIVWSNIQWDNTYQAYHRMNHNNSNGTVYSSFALGIYCDSGLGTKSALNWFQYNYIISLLRIMGKTTHVFDTFGTGYTGTVTKGIGNTAGAFYGFNKSGNVSTNFSKIFFLEQFFGNNNALSGLRGQYKGSGGYYYSEFYYNGGWIRPVEASTYTQYARDSGSGTKLGYDGYNRINGYDHYDTYGFLPSYYGNSRTTVTGTDWPNWDFEASFPYRSYNASSHTYLYLQYMAKTTSHLTLYHITASTVYGSGKRTIQFIT